MQSNGAIPADDYSFLYLIIYYDRFIYVNVWVGGLKIHTNVQK